MWFTNDGNYTIGRITTTGAVTTYHGASISNPQGITAGPDGALWFTNTSTASSSGSIGRITTTGTVTSYASPGIRGPAGIAAGPDGALWFTNNSNGDGTSIGRITTTGTVTSFTAAGLIGPYQIVAGPDGALWFTDVTADLIGRITTTVTPKISSFTPASGEAGTTVTITGQNLSSAATLTRGG
jgi:virginiamycin B lyase